MNRKYGSPFLVTPTVAAKHAGRREITRLLQAVGGIEMLFEKGVGISIIAGTIAAALLVGVPITASGSEEVTESHAQIRPAENFSYELGAKFVSGYFVERAGTCLVTLTVMGIMGKSDPDAHLPLAIASIHLNLYPRQIAGLDGQEGRSLNVTCGNAGSSLQVNFSEFSNKEWLVARPSQHLPNKFVDAF